MLKRCDINTLRVENTTSLKSEYQICNTRQKKHDQTAGKRTLSIQS